MKLAGKSGLEYTSYKANKAHNAIAGNDCKRSWIWYDVIDEYMHGRAHVVCVSHATSSTERVSSVSEDLGWPSTKHDQTMSAECTTTTTRGHSN